MLGGAATATPATPQTAAAAAHPRAQVGQPLREEDARVLDVAYRMAIAGKPWCRSLIPLPGWVLHHLAEYDGPTRASLIAVYGMDRGPGIVAIAPGSAAAAAGLLPGDTILSVNGTALASLMPPPGKLGGELRVPGTRLESAIEGMLARGPAHLSILRDGRTIEATLAVPLACPARIRIADARARNAFADGAYAIFSNRLVQLAATDDALAAAVGHELAHNFLEHAARRRSGAVKERKRDQEAEADAFSLRLTAAAGYDPAAAPAFWEKLLDTDLLELIGIGDHYPKGERLKAIRAGLAEVQASPATVTWNGVTVPRPAR